jgi:hypothetical protein
MLNLSVPKAPPALRLLSELPSVRLQISLREAGILISALEAGAAAAIDAGDARLHRQLRDRAADLRETAASKAKRILGGLSAKQVKRV